MSGSTGTIRILRHESKVLKGNPLNDPHVRDLTVYLPPGYKEQPKPYPVVFCLSGFTGRGKMLLNDNAFGPNMAERLDMLIQKGRISPMIAVMPDCMTKYFGSQFINSSATGRYEEYLATELVEFVDENFDTLADRNSRAVAGISSGGYGAMIMAMKHSEVFGLAASISGDCYFEMCYKPDLGKAFRGINEDPLALVGKFYDETSPKGKFDFDALNIIAMSSCYSANPESELGFDIPFDLKTGILREKVWERWLEHDPYHLVELYVDELKSLRLLYLDAGKHDEINLDIGARAVSRKLRELGITHVHEEFDGGHFGIKHRYNLALETLSNAMHLSPPKNE